MLSDNLGAVIGVLGIVGGLLWAVEMARRPEYQRLKQGAEGYRAAVVFLYLWFCMTAVITIPLLFLAAFFGLVRS